VEEEKRRRKIASAATVGCLRLQHTYSYKRG